MAGSPDKLDFQSDDFRPYAIALGELSLAWNDLHERLAELFWAALGIRNGLIPFSVWYSSKVDRAQRDMLRSLAITPAIGNTLKPKTQVEVKWLLDRADTLEDLRNDALHAPLIKPDNKQIQPSFAMGHQRAKKLKGKNLLKEFRWFYETTIILRDYAWELDSAVRHQHTTLPERPQLPNRGDTNDKKHRRRE